MLYETKEVKPTIVTEKNALIKAMKNNDKVIYIKGALYNDMKKKVNGSKTLKTTKGFGKLGLGLTTVTALLGGPVGWAALAVSLGAIGLSKYQDDFDNYSPKNNSLRERIELYKSKGKNKYDKSTDKITDI